MVRPVSRRKKSSMPASTSSAAEQDATIAAGPENGLTARPQVDPARREKFWLGKVALVTGGSSGLGLSLAEAFARAGANVVISARSVDALEAAAADLRR